VRGAAGVALAALTAGLLGCTGGARGAGHLQQGPCTLAVVQEVGAWLEPTSVPLEPPYVIAADPESGAGRLNFWGSRWRMFDARITGPGRPAEVQSRVSAPGLDSVTPLDYPVLLHGRGEWKIELSDPGLGCLHQVTVTVR
jgi:hypothetical protein